ncbi:MAG: UvrD-helicase domain-containing protein [Planctomycetota bacterium]
MTRLTIMEASAGTGKTYALVERVLQHLEEGIRLPEILVITFTKPAAEELKVRIRLKLRERVHHAGGAVYESALRNFESARISTIHSFFQGLLAEQAFETGRLFKQERKRGVLLTTRVLERFLRGPGGADPAVKACLVGWCTFLEKKMEDLPLFIHELRSAGDQLEPWWDVGQFQKRWVSARQSTMDEWDDALVRCRIDKRQADILREFLRLFLAMPGTGCPQEIAIATLGYNLPKASVYARKAKPNKGGAIDEQLASMLQSLTALHDSCISLESVIASTLLRSLDPEIRAEKTRSGFFDYDDLIHDTRELLRSPRGAALVRSVRSRFRAALVDEFQDTDALQWELLKEVFLEDDTRHLTVIGDPKQAIYSFRGGDVMAYQEALKDLRRKGAESQRLSANHRSSRAMVEALNVLTDPLADAAILPGDDGIGGDTQVVAAKDEMDLVDSQGSSLPPLHVTDLTWDQGGQSMPAESWKRSLALVMAKTMAGYLEPTSTTRIRRNSQSLGVKPSDILVLTASHKESRLMAEALAAHGIPHSLDSKEPVLQSDEAGDWLTLMRALEDPDDSSKRLRVFLTGFFGLKPGDLSSAESSPGLAGMIRQWGAMGDSAALVESVLAQSAVAGLALDQGHARRSLMNYRQVGRLLAGMGSTVTELRRGLEMARFGISGDEETEWTCAGDNAVRIMTVHASKGLEAPLVFLFGGLGRRSARGYTRVYHQGSQRRIWIRCDGDDGVAMQSQSEDQRELCRLAYVALTRAKVGLHLFRLPMGSTWQGFMMPVVRRLESMGPDLTRVARIQSHRVTRRVIMPPAWDGVHEQVQSEEPQLIWPWPPRLHSYSSLRRRDEGEEMALDESPSEIQDGPGGRDFGIYFHALMEEGSFGQLAKGGPEARSLAERLALAHGMDSVAVELALAMARRALAHPLKGGRLHLEGGLQGLRDFSKEWEFLYPVSGGALMKGIADLVFLHEGRAYVLDWKTDAVRPDSLEERVALHYGEQSRIYSSALARHLNLKDGAAYERVFGGAIYLFVRHNVAEGSVFVRHTWDELAQFDKSLRVEHDR